MTCKNCGSAIPESSTVCDVCGAKVEGATVVQNVTPDMQNNIPTNMQNNIPANTGKKKSNVALIIIIIIAVFVLGTIGLIVGVFSIVFNSSDKMVCKSKEGNITLLYNDKKITGYTASGIDYDLDEQQQVSVELGVDTYLKEFNKWFENNTSGTCTIDGKAVGSGTEKTTTTTKSVQNKAKGDYTRDAFSGNSFDYKTNYDSAVITFKEDSRFEFKYASGEIYKGEYELYNGLLISSKADKIAQDKTLSNSDQLAEDIKKVSNAMMDSADGILNTYLIWLETDDKLVQPLVVRYDTETNSGVTVNVYASTSGTIVKK